MAYAMNTWPQQMLSLPESLKRRISRYRDVLQETCKDPASSEHGEFKQGPGCPSYTYLQGESTLVTSSSFSVLHYTPNTIWDLMEPTGPEMAPHVSVYSEILRF